MALTVFWIQFAKDKIDDIFEHYKEKAGIKIAGNLADSIIYQTDGLELQPHIGQIEEP